MRVDLAVREPKSENQISEDAIREQLSLLLDSPMFAQSDRLCRFLRFTVETTLAGKGDVLKEYLIGTEVYERKPPYQPNLDSIVRTEARRLRSKLKEYYGSIGKDDPISIDYQPGSYVPAFRHQRSLGRRCIATDLILAEIFTKEPGTQTLEARTLDVQLVFEGTMRVLRPGSTLKNFKPAPNTSRWNQMRGLVSLSLARSHRR